MMEQFIEEVYHEPYTLLTNNCFHKSLKIVRKARELGKDAHLVICGSIENERILDGLPPVVQPHAYAEIEGERVDVTYDPDTEKILCSNTERTTVLPIRLPKVLISIIAGGV